MAPPATTKVARPKKAKGKVEGQTELLLPIVGGSEPPIGRAGVEGDARETKGWVAPPTSDGPYPPLAGPPTLSATP